MHVCTCVGLILVLVCGIMYHIRTYLVSALYQPATKIRICRYVCAKVGYVLCATYVRKLVWARLFVPGISRLPRYVYVDTYVPGLHPPLQKKNRRPSTGSGSDTRTARVIAQQGECNNYGQRYRGCSCCLMDIESLMIRRPFGSIDPNSIRERASHRRVQTQTGEGSLLLRCCCCWNYLKIIQ